MFWGVSLALAAVAASAVYRVTISVAGYRGGRYAQTLRQLGIVSAPFVLLWVAISFAMATIPNLGDPIRQAVIAGSALAAGWFVTSAFQDDQRQRAREEATRDLLFAIRTEIFTALERLDQFDWMASSAEVQGRIRDGADDPATAYHPFTASESPMIVFDKLAGNIQLLKDETIEPVLRFYAMQSDLATFAADCRDEIFQALSAERRIVAHKRLTTIRLGTLYWSLKALRAINAEIGVPNPDEIPRSGMNPAVVVS